MTAETQRTHFRIWQDGMVVSQGWGANKDAMLREMGHYALVYSQDGPIEKIETRTEKGRWKEYR